MQSNKNLVLQIWLYALCILLYTLYFGYMHYAFYLQAKIYSGTNWAVWISFTMTLSYMEKDQN